MRPTILIGDVKYELMVDGIETVFEHDRVTFTARNQKRVVNKCDHCGRFNLEQIELYTVDELVENGWIREAPRSEAVPQ